MCLTGLSVELSPGASNSPSGLLGATAAAVPVFLDLANWGTNLPAPFWSWTATACNQSSIPCSLPQA